MWYVLRSFGEVIQGLIHFIHEQNIFYRIYRFDLFHSAFRFITSCGYQTQHYTLYALYLLHVRTEVGNKGLKVQYVRLVCK